MVQQHISVMRKRGATVTVAAFGEVLFHKGGDIDQFNNSLSHYALEAAARYAPSNKRPRWGHYGAPLKSTMRAHTNIDFVTMRAAAVVGSRAHYAQFVDQGTGVYAGNGPYEAKILPPWTRGSPTLYEKAWIDAIYPNGGKRKPGAVMIKGQKGQFFFDKALSSAMRKKGLRFVPLPADLPTSGAASGRYVVENLLGLLGSTPVDGAFIAQLEEWRSWRDEAFAAKTGLGNTSRLGRQANGATGKTTKSSGKRDVSPVNPVRDRVRKTDSITLTQRQRDNMTRAELKELVKRDTLAQLKRRNDYSPSKFDVAIKGDKVIVRVLTRDGFKILAENNINDSLKAIMKRRG